jgi:hypothetical protein
VQDDTVVTPGMVAGCCYVITVTVDSIGIVLERTDASRPLGEPGSARAAARVAHHPPVVARGPMAFALRLVHNELLVVQDASIDPVVTNGLG